MLGLTYYTSLDRGWHQRWQWQRRTQRQRQRQRQKYWKDPTCAIFLKRIWLKDIKYDDGGWISDDALGVMHRGWCTRDDAQGVMHRGWCTRGDAPVVMHRGWCTRGDALSLMHFSFFLFLCSVQIMCSRCFHWASIHPCSVETTATHYFNWV